MLRDRLNRKRQYPATIAGGARANATEGSEPRPSHRERRQQRQRPPRAATAPNNGSKRCDVQRGPPRGTRTRTDAGKPPCYRCGGKHAPRDCRFKRTPFVTRARSEVIWPECAARTERKAQLQVGMVLAENSRSKRTHWKVKRAVRQASTGKRTPYSL